MLALLDRLSRLGAPEFEGDDTKTREAHALNMVLLILSALVVLNALGVVLIYTQKLGASLLLGALFILILVAGSLMRRGRVRRASQTIVAGCWILLSAQIMFSGGAYGAGALSSAFVCVLAGLLLGPHAAIAALIASAVFYSGLAAANALGHPPPQYFPSKPGALLVFYGIFLLLFLALLAFHSMRQALDTAHTKELQFRQAIEQAVDGIIITDAAGRALLVNSALKDILGYTEAESSELSVLATYLPEEREVGADRIRRLAAGERLRFERVARRRDGTTVLVEVTAARLDDGRLQAIVRDVSERRRSEHLLQESEARLKTLLMAALDAHVTMSAAGLITGWNTQAEAVFGWSSAEVLGRPLADVIIPPAQRERHRRGLERFLTTGEGPILSRRVELTALRRGGQEFPVELSVTPIRSDSEWFFSSFIRDITEPRRAADALRESEERFRLLSEAAFEGLGITDKGKVVDVNSRMAEMLGYQVDEMRGMSVVDLVAPEHQELVLAHLRSGSPEPYEHLAMRKDGAPLPVEVQGRSIPYGGRNLRVTAVRDMSDRYKAEAARLHLEEQLRQAQKMEALGQLAGGVAHDFNNLLSAIVGYSQLLLNDLELDDRRREDVEEITKAADRATLLTRQLLAFSRRQVLQPNVLSLNAVVGSVEKLLRRLIGEHITFVTSPDPTLGYVKADQGQIEQVIVNLAINARDAMPKGGTLTIETSNVEVDALAPPVEVGIMPPGPYAFLKVSDTGIGMDEATMARVFEPFFTTKPEGRGTGLGLATVFGIVKQSAGFITVDSVPKHGTTFCICLPRLPADGPANDAEPARPTAPRGTEMILLVEDDPVVRAVTYKLLRRQGYNVVQAADGLAAMRAVAEAKGQISLLITDVVMPTLSGPALVEQVMIKCPHIKVLYVSGHADSALLHHGVLEPGVHFLAKPVNPGALAQKVRELLDAS